VWTKCSVFNFYSRCGGVEEAPTELAVQWRPQTYRILKIGCGFFGNVLCS